VKYQAIFTLILSLYLLSFSVLSKRLILPSLKFALAGLLFFPISAFISRIMKAYPKRNLFLPLEVALIASTLANLASIGSPAFFAVMFLVQAIVLPLAFVVTAYEFGRERLGLIFLLSFLVWFGAVLLLGQR